jgi:hypothetical protein
MKNVSDTLAVRVYGPYLEKNGDMAWWVYPPGKEDKRKACRTKLAMLQCVDSLTTVPVNLDKLVSTK